MKNLFADLPADLPEEITETLVGSQHVRIVRIVSLGHSSPEGFWYDQPHEEWVVVLQGAARLTFENENKPVEMRPGDWKLIPAHKRHRVAWTSPYEPTIWLAIHFEPLTRSITDKN